MPKVSVVIPNYNHAPYLEQRIGSVLGQTFTDVEVILLDDASTDHSREILDRFACADTRIRTAYNEINSGSPFKQWNRGVRMAAGQYVWIAESDDWAEPTLLEQLVALLDDNPSVAIAYCRSWRTDVQGRRTDLVGQDDNIARTFGSQKMAHDWITNGREECARCVYAMCLPPNASCALLRKSTYEQVGPINERFRHCGDWITWAIMLLYGDVAYHAQPLNYFRRHVGSVGARSRLNGVAIEEYYRVRDYIQRAVPLPTELLEQYMWESANRWMYWFIRRSGWRRLGQNYRIWRAGRRADTRMYPRVAQMAVANLRRRSRPEEETDDAATGCHPKP
jgi:glycosyltransferase involved in cell wall biosynthesis